ncbi:hypothetical protein CZ814_00905 [Photobacterium toruni]|uniref:Uncharacterized protein n=1 Tax=Photobacterium toruni TaxID=1935446 RepID=A0A1T4PYK5_9GAMM|nr:hypothetical protein CZ814_00905 [Photobacterium toruni]
MTYRVYSIVSIFIINLILFNWHSQQGIFSLAIILWALVPLFGLHYIIKQYECCHNKPLTMIKSYSAWILFFAWVTCLCFSTIYPYFLNIISDTNSHYISLYIFFPAVTLFITAIAAFIASMMMIIITHLIR